MYWPGKISRAKCYTGIQLASWRSIHRVWSHLWKKQRAKLCLHIGIVLVIYCCITNHPKLNWLGICDLGRLGGDSSSLLTWQSTRGWDHLQAHSLTGLGVGTGYKLGLSWRRSRNTCLAFTCGCVPRVSIYGEEGSVSQKQVAWSILSLEVSGCHVCHTLLRRAGGKAHLEARGGDIRSCLWREECETCGF